MTDRITIEKIDFEFEVPITKTDDDQQIAFGWASVAITKEGEVVLDRQGDFIDSVDEFEASAYDYVINSRDAGEQHVRKGVGSLVESFVVTPEKLAAMGLAKDALPTGWWTGYKVHDDAVWAGVKDDTYPMLSVHGTGRREVVS